MPDEQPPPVPNGDADVWLDVIELMRERRSVGIARYGTPLQPFNGRSAERDAFEEALDLVVYLRQAMIERAALNAELNRLREEILRNTGLEIENAKLKAELAAEREACARIADCGTNEGAIIAAAIRREFDQPTSQNQSPRG